MFNSAFSQGKTVGDQKSLILDPGFPDMGRRSEFKKFFAIYQRYNDRADVCTVIGRLSSGPKQQSPRSVRTEAFLFGIALPA
jgi:hypothetical protein